MILLKLISLVALASAATPFQLSTDSLCFQNADPRLKQYGPLGQLGSNQGVCQGMAGIAGAFYEMGSFDPSRPKPAAKQAQEIIDRFIRRHAGGCSNQEVVPGYESLRQFCEANTEIFLKRSISYNASIAVIEILPKLPQFFILKSKPIRSERHRRQLHATVQGLIKKLNSGRAPLVMVYSHVTNVIGVSELRFPSGRKNVTLTTYDSNNNQRTHSQTIAYEADGLPALTNRMIWDVTPDRRVVGCH